MDHLVSRIKDTLFSFGMLSAVTKTTSTISFLLMASLTVELTC
jgi:hypothetical protein